MPVFHPGQRVLIAGSIPTKHRGREATIVSFNLYKPAVPGVTSADKYSVQFEEGDEAEFFEIQLAAENGK